MKDEESFVKIPSVPGLLTYREDDKKLYVNKGPQWEALSSEKTVLDLVSGVRRSSEKTISDLVSEIRKTTKSTVSILFMLNLHDGRKVVLDTAVAMAMFYEITHHSLACMKHILTK